MASQRGTIDYLLEQIETAGVVRSRRMFGEAAIYCNDRVVAIVCDDLLYVKPTDGGRRYLGEVVERSPFPGAKPWLFVGGDQWEDADWVTGLIRVTASEVPLPKPKATKARAAAKVKKPAPRATSKSLPKAATGGAAVAQGRKPGPRGGRTVGRP